MSINNRFICQESSSIINNNKAILTTTATKIAPCFIPQATKERSTCPMNELSPYSQLYSCRSGMGDDGDDDDAQDDEFLDHGDFGTTIPFRGSNNATKQLAQSQQSSPYGCDTMPSPPAAVIRSDLELDQYYSEYQRQLLIQQNMQELFQHELFSKLTPANWATAFPPKTSTELSISTVTFNKIYPFFARLARSWKRYNHQPISHQHHHRFSIPTKQKTTKNNLRRYTPPDSDLNMYSSDSDEDILSLIATSNSKRNRAPRLFPPHGHVVNPLPSHASSLSTSSHESSDDSELSDQDEYKPQSKPRPLNIASRIHPDHVDDADLTNNQSNVLILYGPAGSGKSACVDYLCDLYNFQPHFFVHDEPTSSDHEAIRAYKQGQVKDALPFITNPEVCTQLTPHCWKLIAFLLKTTQLSSTQQTDPRVTHHQLLATLENSSSVSYPLQTSPNLSSSGEESTGEDFSDTGPQIKKAAHNKRTRLNGAAFNPAPNTKHAQISHTSSRHPTSNDFVSLNNPPSQPTVLKQPIFIVPAYSLDDCPQSIPYIIKVLQYLANRDGTNQAPIVFMITTEYGDDNPHLSRFKSINSYHTTSTSLSSSGAYGKKKGYKQVDSSLGDYLQITVVSTPPTTELVLDRALRTTLQRARQTIYELYIDYINYKIAGLGKLFDNIQESPHKYIQPTGSSPNEQLDQLLDSVEEQIDALTDHGNSLSSWDFLLPDPQLLLVPHHVAPKQSQHDATRSPLSLSKQAWLHKFDQLVIIHIAPLARGDLREAITTLQLVYTQYYTPDNLAVVRAYLYPPQQTAISSMEDHTFLLSRIQQLRNIYHMSKDATRGQYHLVGKIMSKHRREDKSSVDVLRTKPSAIASLSDEEITSLLLPPTSTLSSSSEAFAHLCAELVRDCYFILKQCDADLNAIKARQVQKVPPPPSSSSLVPFHLRDTPLPYGDGDDDDPKSNLTDDVLIKFSDLTTSALDTPGIIDNIQYNWLSFIPCYEYQVNTDVLSSQTPPSVENGYIHGKHYSYFSSFNHQANQKGVESLQMVVTPQSTLSQGESSRHHNVHAMVDDASLGSSGSPAEPCHHPILSQQQGAMGASMSLNNCSSQLSIHSAFSAYPGSMVSSPTLDLPSSPPHLSINQSQRLARYTNYWPSSHSPSVADVLHFYNDPGLAPNQQQQTHRATPPPIPKLDISSYYKSPPSPHNSSMPRPSPSSQPAHSPQNSSLDIPPSPTVVLHEEVAELQHKLEYHYDAPLRLVTVIADYFSDAQLLYTGSIRASDKILASQVYDSYRNNSNALNSLGVASPVTLDAPLVLAAKGFNYYAHHIHRNAHQRDNRDKFSHLYNKYWVTNSAHKLKRGDDFPTTTLPIRYNNTTSAIFHQSQTYHNNFVRMQAVIDTKLMVLKRALLGLHCNLHKPSRSGTQQHQQSQQHQHQQQSQMTPHDILKYGTILDYYTQNAAIAVWKAEGPVDALHNRQLARRKYFSQLCSKVGEPGLEEKKQAVLGEVVLSAPLLPQSTLNTKSAPSFMARHKGRGRDYHSNLFRVPSPCLSQYLSSFVGVLDYISFLPHWYDQTSQHTELSQSLYQTHVYYFPSLISVHYQLAPSPPSPTQCVLYSKQLAGFYTPTEMSPHQISTYFTHYLAITSTAPHLPITENKLITQNTVPLHITLHLPHTTSLMSIYPTSLFVFLKYFFRPDAGISSKLSHLASKTLNGPPSPTTSYGGDPAIQEALASLTKSLKISTPRFQGLMTDVLEANRKMLTSIQIQYCIFQGHVNTPPATSGNFVISGIQETTHSTAATIQQHAQIDLYTHPLLKTYRDYLSANIAIWKFFDALVVATQLQESHSDPLRQSFPLETLFQVLISLEQEQISEYRTHSVATLYKDTLLTKSAYNAPPCQTIGDREHLVTGAPMYQPPLLLPNGSAVNMMMVAGGDEGGGSTNDLDFL